MLKVIELFAGIGSQTKALKNIGVKHEVVAICEFDRYADQSYRAVHGEVNNLGDITKVKELPYCDLLTYSFPCQDISVAGKGQGLSRDSGTRSGLLWEVERLLKQMPIKPKYLLLENVKNLVGKKNKADFEEWLNELDKMGYVNYWDILNAKNYGIPQNRERVFVVSIRKDVNAERKPYEVGWVDNMTYKFPDPFDNGLRLEDMLEDEVDEKYYVSQDKVDKLLMNLNKGNGVTDYEQPSGLYLHDSLAFSKDLLDGKSRCLKANKFDSAVAIPVLTPDRVEKRQNGRRFKEDGDPMFALTGQDRHGVLVIDDTQGFDGVRTYDDESPCLRSQRSGVKVLVSNEVKQIGNIVSTGNWSDPQRGRIYDPDGCSPALNTVGGGGLEPKILVKETTKQGYAIAEEGDSINIQFPNSKTRRGRVGKQVAQTLETSCNQAVIQRYRIRKLVPLETWRLMGFDDEDFYKAEKVCSNSQLYKQAGNSIVVDVLEGIFTNLFKEVE